MGTIKSVLFGKVDLDTIATAFVMGANPIEQVFVAISGSASSSQLADPSNLCIEVGGSGRTEDNNFDHHNSGQTSLSAAAQSLERLAKIIRYVDDVDCGRLTKKKKKVFPSLVQLISGMLLVVKNPEDQMKQGLVILREVLHSGIDPYGCMEPILKEIPDAHIWVSKKREHEKKMQQICGNAMWFTTKAGRKLAVVESDLFGIPGVMQGQGAEIVVALNPEHRSGKKAIRKFTICGSGGIRVDDVLKTIVKKEDGWGGPAHGTIIGSPTNRDSTLSKEEVANIVVNVL